MVVLARQSNAERRVYLNVTGSDAPCSPEVEPPPFGLLMGVFGATTSNFVQ